MAQPIVLSSPEMNAHFRQQKLLSRPEVQKMTKLDEQISSTLARTDIGEDEKYEIYSGILSDFRKIHNDVIRKGIYSSPEPPLFPQSAPQEPPESDILKGLAELLKSVKNEREDEQLISGSNANKLENELNRDAKLQKDLINKYFLDRNSGSFDSSLWNQTLDFLTKENLNVSRVPPEIISKAQRIYTFMLNNKSDISSWTKKYPLFKHIASQSQIAKRIPQAKKGSGISTFHVDWKKWDNHSTF